MRRTLAWIGIIAIVLGFAALVYFTATGASANVIMAALFVMLVFPVIIYGLLMLQKFLNRSQDSSEDDN